MFNLFWKISKWILRNSSLKKRKLWKCSLKIGSPIQLSSLLPLISYSINLVVNENAVGNDALERSSMFLKFNSNEAQAVLGYAPDIANREVTIFRNLWISKSLLSWSLARSRSINNRCWRKRNLVLAKWKLRHFWKIFTWPIWYLRRNDRHCPCCSI